MAKGDGILEELQQHGFVRNYQWENDHQPSNFVVYFPQLSDKPIRNVRICVVGSWFPHSMQVGQQRRVSESRPQPCTNSTDLEKNQMH